MTLPSEETRACLNVADKETHDWLYEVTRDPITSTILLGAAMRIAAEHQEWNYWRVMAEVRKHITVVYEQTGRTQ